MSECECLPTCPFFNDRMQGNNELIDFVKQRYCKGTFDLCARYQVFKVLGKGNVPEDLWPLQTSKVKDIIE